MTEGIVLTKKKRTRQHVIADLSANHTERHALLCGFSVERALHDYGIDLTLFTYSETGEAENGPIYIQLKATDHLQVLADQQTITFPISRSDLELWLLDPMPWIFILYDAKSDIAYWIYIQEYFKCLPNFDLSKVGETITVHIPKLSVLDQRSIKHFAQIKQEILEKIRELI